MVPFFPDTVYRVLTTAQPSYLHHLITVQPHCSTRCSSVVTLSHPLSSSSLQITDQSFRYASPRLWNQVPASLQQLHAGCSILDSDLPTPTSSALSINSPLSLSISPSLFYSQLKTYLFQKSHHRSYLSPGLTQRTLAADHFLAFPVFVSVPCGRLSWLLLAFDCTLISHYYLPTYLCPTATFKPVEY